MKTFALLALAGLATTASADVVGYYTEGNSGTTAPAGGITANGHTAVQILDITTFDLSTIDCLVLNNSDNGSLGSLSSRIGDIDAWVFGGGFVVSHDRFVSTGFAEANPLLFGSGGSLAVRDFNNDADIDIFTSTSVDNGPFGTLDNSSLDGGTSSSHGYVDASTLPGGATVHLIRGGAPGEAVTVSYAYGAGGVMYSTIPLDYYLDGNGGDPPQGNMNTIYYPNALYYLKSIPAPSSLALLGLGGLAMSRRRR